MIVTTTDQLNSTIHGTMKTTPYELVFGQPPMKAFFPGAHGVDIQEEDVEDLLRDDIQPPPPTKHTRPPPLAMRTSPMTHSPPPPPMMEISPSPAPTDTLPPPTSAKTHPPLPPKTDPSPASSETPSDAHHCLVHQKNT